MPGRGRWHLPSPLGYGLHNRRVRIVVGIGRPGSLNGVAQTVEGFIDDPEMFWDRVREVPEYSYKGTPCQIYGQALEKIRTNAYVRVTLRFSNGSSTTAPSHRLAMILRLSDELGSELTDEEHVDHLCPQKWCCNLEHLQILSAGDNVRKARAAFKGEIARLRTENESLRKRIAELESER